MLTTGFKAVTDLSVLTKLPNLKWLIVGRQRSSSIPSDADINDIYPIASCKNLWYLSIDSAAISDLSPLSGLGNLAELSLENTDVTDLSPVAGLPLVKFSITRLF